MQLASLEAVRRLWQRGDLDDHLVLKHNRRAATRAAHAKAFGGCEYALGEEEQEGGDRLLLLLLSALSVSDYKSEAPLRCVWWHTWHCTCLIFIPAVRLRT